MSSPNKTIVKMLLLLVLVAVLFGVAISCTPVETVKRQDETSNFKYEKVIIEGMTCLLWNKHDLATSSRVGGLTCNWDEWRGGQ